MYAVIQDSGQQFRVSEGDILDVDLRELSEKAKTIDFDRVLLIREDKDIKVGTPLVKGAKVTAEILDREAKGPKVHAYYLRRRKASRKKIGHRQKYVRVKITKIKG
jgi:large subunit ribosomal protein L21